MSPRTKRDIDGDLVIAGNLTVLGGLNQKHFLKVRTDLASTSEAVANIEASSAELLSFTYLERRYFRSDTKPPTPTGSSPTGWELSPPLGSAKLWMTQASRRGDGALLSDWSTPISSTARQPVTLYMRSSTRPVTPSGADPAGWSKAPPTGGAMLWGVNGFYVLSPGSSSPGALRPHVGLRPSEGLRPFSPSWSAPYLVLDAIHSKPVGYLGKFTNHPPSRSGDWWLIYAASDTPIQRGVWLNDAGTYRRIASDTAADSVYIAPALTDILEVANAGYGVVSNYGAVTFIGNLVANAAFINTLSANVAFVDELTANSAFVDNLVANDTFVANLAAKNAFLEKIVTMSIILNGGEIKSSNFSAGVSGFRLKSDGSAEFGSGVFRGFVNSGIKRFAALADWQTMNLSGSMGIVVSWGEGDYGNAALPVNVAAVLYSVSSYYTAGTFVTRIEFNPLMNASFIRKITVTEPYKSTEVLQYGVSGVGVNYGGYTCIKII